MDPLVLEVVRGVPSVEPQLLGLVAVGPVLLIALADQESNPLLAFLKQKSSWSRNNQSTRRAA